MAKLSDDWKVVRQLISDRNDAAEAMRERVDVLERENKQLRAAAGQTAGAFDDADKAALEEIGKLADAVRANSTDKATDDGMAAAKVDINAAAALPNPPKISA